MGNYGKHVFVLGAGASHESANIPLGKDLVWNYHVDCGLLVPYDNTRPDLREENENFTNYRKFLELAASIFPEFKSLPKKWDNRGMNVFRLYSRLEKRHYIDELLELLQKQGNKEGAKLVKYLIFEHIAQASFNRPNTSYKRFVKEILKIKRPQTTSVISLNFDCMLQEKEFINEVYFDYLINFDWIDHNRTQFYRCSNPIPLIKLNGSLDWGICENCGRLHLYYPFMYRTFYKNKACTKQQCGGGVTPFIVIPHEKYGEKINSLWNIAKNHLKDADQVTVIGYSFPEYDKDVIKLFQDSLNTNVRIEVVDKCQNDQKKKQTEYLKKKYMELFKLSIEIITLDGFSDYLDIQGNQADIRRTSNQKGER
ncbi:MAG: hypothetical protein PHI16_05500 [Methanocellales archaeon]|nr:hypothetical protein [Methanocellales archaeon]